MFYRLIILIFLFHNPLHPRRGLPFFTLSDATLSISQKTIVGQSDRNEQVYFPFFSQDPPQKKIVKNLGEVPSVDGEVLFIIDDNVGLVAHYFHFLEHLVGIWNFLTYQSPDQVKLILFDFKNPSDQDLQWGGLSNDTTRLLLTSLFPNASMGLLRDFSQEDLLSAKKIHISSRCRSHGIPQARRRNMNGSARFKYVPERLWGMRDRIFTHLGIIPEPRGDKLRITYCKRTVGRMLDEGVEGQLLSAIAKETGEPVKIVDFAQISYREQLQMIANTDLFIAIHGNGLSHLLFLPDNATVVEYYAGGESAFFRTFAKIRGIRYFGNSGDRWVTEDYNSLKNKAPFQADVSHLDLQGTMDIVRSCQKAL